MFVVTLLPLEYLEDLFSVFALEYSALMQRKMSGYVEIFVPAPQKCMGIIIGTGGRNIKELQHETHTRITKSNGDEFGRGSGFTVTGTETGCEAARLAIQRHIVSISILYTYLSFFSCRPHKRSDNLTELGIESGLKSNALSQSRLVVKSLISNKNCIKEYSKGTSSSGICSFTDTKTRE